jgi:phosphoenolpyruvate synthase/pyruvate phosphate dikinase
MFQESQDIWFDHLTRNDVPRVGGKNASLGEMVSKLGPAGFKTTAEAYRLFVERNGLQETISSALRELDSGKTCLAEAGQMFRRAFLRSEWPEETTEALRSAYRELSRCAGTNDLELAVSSDHPEFAESLVHCEIHSLSVSPDSFIRVKHHVALAEGLSSSEGTSAAVLVR